MKKSQLLCLAFIVSVFFPSLIVAANSKTDPDIIRLQEQLSLATTPKDSLKILYNIYDLSPRDRKTAVGKNIFYVAQRAGDIAAQLDILRQNSNYYKDATDIIRLQQYAAKLPKTREQQETMLFLKMRALSYSTRLDSPETQVQELSKLVTKLSTTPEKQQNSYQRLYNLYAVSSYLRHHSNSPVLLQYLDSMISMVNRNDYKLYALRNQVYSEAARIYTDAGMPRQAVEADKHLIKIIDGLQKKYEESGRKYRNLDQSRYVVYRRMLKNYKALTPAEVDDYYAKIQALVAKDPDVAADFNTGYTVHPYYLMARNRYSDAIPSIKDALKHTDILPVQRQLYEMLQTAARHTGDTTTLVNSLDAYNAIVSRIDSLDAAQKYKELQVAYDVSFLKERNSQLRAENAEAESQQLQQKMSLAMFAWVIIAILLVILLFIWSRFRTNINHISAFACSLAQQRENIKTDRFGDYNKSDLTVSKLKHTYDSQKLLHSILNDILYISALGHDDRQRHLSTVSMDKVLHRVEKGISESHNSDYNLSIQYPDPDFKIRTDVECLVYLMTRLCDYAQSHSDMFDVSVKTVHHDNSPLFHIIFTHTGDKIKQGSEEVLFGNIIDWNEISQRNDSSLFISRLIALLLQTSIVYNPHSSEMPQLILTMPVRPSDFS